MKIHSHYIPDRDQWILKQCTGKRVLHLGCTDWPVTADRLRAGKLLHQKLASVCSLVVGVDPDEEGIKSLRQFMPAHEFHVSTAEQMHAIPEIASVDWDIILAADVVEHISNLGAALDSISQLMSASTELVITTPSAFSVKRFLSFALAGTEHVHPDHCYYFSPSTLKQMLGRSGLKMKDYGFFMWKNDKAINKLALCLMAPANYLLQGAIADEIAISCVIGDELRAGSHRIGPAAMA
jgi:2-polyprenyl-3-methyl-5-hydroxy-6-metoxy-1,4-benzoquinol methylase